MIAGMKVNVRQAPATFEVIPVLAAEGAAAGAASSRATRRRAARAAKRCSLGHLRTTLRTECHAFFSFRGIRGIVAS